MANNEGDPVRIYEDLKARVEKTKVKLDPIYGELAARVGDAESEYLQRAIAKLANLEQARLIMALPDTDRDRALGRGLEVSDGFTRKLGLDKGEAEKHIQELYEKGLLFPTRQGPLFARSRMQIHDAVLCAYKYDNELGREFFDLWGAMEGIMKRPAPQDLRPERAVFRVVPRWKSIKDIPGVQPWEDIRKSLKKQQTLAVVRCACKRAHTDRWCGVPDEVCINVGRTAEYNIDRGAGRQITYEEAMGILDELDEYPLVHTTINQKEVSQLVCNCHYCCCGVAKGASPSRFIAEIDPEKCNGCEICLDRCQYGAMEMRAHPGLGEQRAHISAEICRGCGCCVVACPTEACTMKIVRPPEHVPDRLGIY